MPFTSSRNAGLDLIRAIAILLVVFAHSQSLFQLMLPHTKFGRIFSYSGFLGVEMFFVLSGFLVGSLINRQLERTHYLNIVGYLNFLLRRWMKTLPIYYIIILLVVGVNFVTNGTAYLTLPYLYSKPN